MATIWLWRSGRWRKLPIEVWKVNISAGPIWKIPTIPKTRDSCYHTADYYRTICEVPLLQMLLCNGWKFKGLKVFFIHSKCNLGARMHGVKKVPSLKFHFIRCSGTMSMILGISRPILSMFWQTAIRNDFCCLCLSPFSNMEGTWSPRRLWLNRKLPNPFSFSTYKEKKLPNSRKL